MADNEEGAKVEPQADEEKPQGGAGDGPTGEGDGQTGRRATKPALDLFDFEEKPKKKPKAKGKKKPPPRPTKAEYEATLADLNAILADLRRKAFKMDEVNMEHSKALVETQELDREVSQHLERVEKRRLQTVIEEEEYQKDIIKKRREMEEQTTARIRELTTEFDKTEKQLLSEIEMLNYKFRTLCTFADGGEKALERMSNLEVEYKQSEQYFKDRLFEIQNKNIVLRKKTDDEANARFDQIIDDFTESREVRNAAYTRRLLSENSDLRRKYNKLIPINLRKERQLVTLMSKTNVYKDTYDVVNDITKRLEATQEKRNDILHRLKKSYDFYKLHVITGSKFRKMYEAVKEYEEKEMAKFQDKTVLFNDIEENTQELLEKYRSLKEVETKYLYQRQQYDLFVDSVKDAAFSLCNLWEYRRLFPKSFDEYVSKRDGIVRGLIDLLTTTERPAGSKQMRKAKYYKGYLGFMPLDYVLCKFLNEKCFDNVQALESVPSFCKREIKFEMCKKEDENIDEVPSDPRLQCLPI